MTWASVGLWLRARWAWLVAATLAAAALVGYGRSERRRGRLEARADALEVAREDDAQRAEAELTAAGETSTAEQLVREEGAERAKGPHTRRDLDALRERVAARRKR
jgi:hypothetical protein